MTAAARSLGRRYDIGAPGRRRQRVVGRKTQTKAATARNRCVCARARPLCLLFGYRAPPEISCCPRVAFIGHLLFTRHPIYRRPHSWPNGRRSACYDRPDDRCRRSPVRHAATTTTVLAWSYITVRRPSPAWR